MLILAEYSSEFLLIVDIVPKDTLIIIDEIQESAAALGCLKYFKEDFPQYDVAVAGSLLDISIHEDQSFPVGMVELVPEQGE